jgi:hypothetical protein
MSESNNNHNPHREFITPDNAVMLFYRSSGRDHDRRYLHYKPAMTSAA